MTRAMPSPSCLPYKSSAASTPKRARKKRPPAPRCTRTSLTERAVSADATRSAPAGKASANRSSCRSAMSGYSKRSFAPETRKPSAHARKPPVAREYTASVRKEPGGWYGQKQNQRRNRKTPPSMDLRMGHPKLLSLRKRRGIRPKRGPKAPPSESARMPPPTSRVNQTLHCSVNANGDIICPNAAPMVGPENTEK